MSEATNTATLKRIPVDKSQSPNELIQDTQSAISYSMNSFSQDEGMMADRSMMTDDPELNRAPANRPLKEQGSQTHAEPVETTEPSAFVEAMTADDAPAPVEQTVVPAKKETQKDFNMRTMREQKEAAERKLKEMENAYNQRQQWESQQQYNNRPQYNQPQKQANDEINIPDEELIDGRQFKKILAQVKQEYTGELQRISQESAAMAAASRLKTQFADFDRVVNTDAIKDLATIYPEEYQAALATKDVYAAGKTMYNMIRNFGILDLHDAPAPAQKQNTYQDQDRRIQNNLTKPRTAAKVGMQADGSTLGQLGNYSRRILTEADKERVRDRLKNDRMYSN